MNWLSIQDGLQPVYEEQQGEWVAVRPLRSGYRLPTEAEWEWAARFAGLDAGLVYPWGPEPPPPDRSGNYADISAREILPTTLVTYNDGYPVSAPSGTFDPNAVGIRDLGGNVAEWVQDFYSIDTAETTDGGGRSARPGGRQSPSRARRELAQRDGDRSARRRAQLQRRVARRSRVPNRTQSSVSARSRAMQR